MNRVANVRECLSTIQAFGFRNKIESEGGKFMIIRSRPISFLELLQLSNCILNKLLALKDVCYLLVVGTAADEGPEEDKGVGIPRERDGRIS